jgi:hypothetical protein
MRTYLYRLLLGTAAALWVGMGATNLQADVVWSNSSDNSFFTPLNPGNTQLIYGDSGWFGGGNDAPVRLSKIELGLAVSSLGSSAAGTTDMIFRLYDGAPEGIVFGSGDLLFEQRLESVALPAVSFEQPTYFFLDVDLGGVQTRGGFNNFGWSIQLQNYNYTGNFGFQASTAGGQTAGFYTNNAFLFTGSSWELFSFGSDPNTGIANFRATLTAVPEPSSAGLLSLAALAGWFSVRRYRAKA